TAEPVEAPVDAAMDALASWLGPAGDRGSMEVAGTEQVTWSNGCLDIAVPAQACTDALVPGFRVTVALGDATYEVRTDDTGDVTRWAPDTKILVRFSEASTNVLEFTTDDDGTIVAQAVPGTTFDIDIDALVTGDAIGIGLVDSPQGEGLILVWVAPA